MRDVARCARWPETQPSRLAREQPEQAKCRQDNGDQQDNQRKDARDADRLCVSFLLWAHVLTVTGR